MLKKKKNLLRERAIKTLSTAARMNYQTLFTAAGTNDQNLFTPHVQLRDQGPALYWYDLAHHAAGWDRYNLPRSTIARVSWVGPVPRMSLPKPLTTAR